MGVAMKAKPDYESELQNVSAKLGVPIETARNLPDDVMAQAKVKDLDVDQLTIDYPLTSKFLMDPSNAMVASDDVGIMKNLETGWGAFKSGIEKGSMQDEIASLHYADMEGDITPDQQMRRGQLKQMMGDQDARASKDESSLDYFLNQTGYSARQMVTSVREGGKGAAVGAAAGAGPALLLGQLGPQVALPEALVTVRRWQVPGTATSARRLSRTTRPRRLSPGTSLKTLKTNPVDLLIRRRRRVRRKRSAYLTLGSRPRASSQWRSCSQDSISSSLSGQNRLLNNF